MDAEEEEAAGSAVLRLLADFAAAADDDDADDEDEEEDDDAEEAGVVRCSSDDAAAAVVGEACIEARAENDDDDDDDFGGGEVGIIPLQPPCEPSSEAKQSGSSEDEATCKRGYCGMEGRSQQNTTTIYVVSKNVKLISISLNCADRMDSNYTLHKWRHSVSKNCYLCFKNKICGTAISVLSSCFLRFFHRMNIDLPTHPLTHTCAHTGAIARHPTSA